MSLNQAIANADDSVLMVIDIQQRLSAAMPAESRAGVLRQVGMLLTAADTLDIPLIVTEQYPKGLGPTEAELQQKLTDNAVVIEKTAFSAAEVDEVAQQLRNLGRKQIILTGMEAHICIMQTALHMLKQGFNVMVVTDAVCSRSDSHYQNALQRLQAAGAILSNAESVLFEWLGDARHPHFRALSKLIL